MRKELFMDKNIKKELPISNGLQGTKLNIACPPFEFLKDAFEENPQKRDEFLQAIKVNGLEYDYELFKAGIGASEYLLKIIDNYFGNIEFWRNVSFSYLSYVAQLHFPAKRQKVNAILQ